VPMDGSFDVVAACGHRACTLSMTGALTCWGRDPPRVASAATGYAHATMVAGAHVAVRPWRLELVGPWWAGV
jgi:hypothetical protein